MSPSTSPGNVDRDRVRRAAVRGDDARDPREGPFEPEARAAGRGSVRKVRGHRLVQHHRVDVAGADGDERQPQALVGARARALSRKPGPEARAGPQRGVVAHRGLRRRAIRLHGGPHLTLADPGVCSRTA